MKNKSSRDESLPTLVEVYIRRRYGTEDVIDVTIDSRDSVGFTKVSGSDKSAISYAQMHPSWDSQNGSYDGAGFVVTSPIASFFETVRSRRRPS